MSRPAVLLLSALLLLATQGARGAAIKLGVWASDVPNARLYEEENGTYTGYEALLIEGLRQQGLDLELVPLATVDDRLAAVQEGRVDASLGAISFHPSRTLRIDFIYPGVYVAGATLFAPGGRLEGVGAWTDLAGVRVAALRGYYALNILSSAGAEPVLVDSFAEGAAAVARGAAAALLADTDAAAVAGLQRLAALPPLASSSYHLVTQNVRSPLSARLAAALAALAAGGAEARLLAYERATYGAAGVPPCHALLELSADPNVTGAGTVNTAKLAAPRPPLRLGVWAAGTPTSYRGPNGAWAGYEARVVGAFAATNQQAFNLTWLGSLDERLEALEGGEVDVVVGAFSVTPERKQRVTFLKPYLYSAGATLYAPGGALQGAAGWVGVQGLRVATRKGYFANAALEALGARLVMVKDDTEAEAAVEAGRAQAYAADATVAAHGRLLRVQGLQPIAVAPYAVAVRRGDNRVAGWLTTLLEVAASGGTASPLLKAEAETYGVQGLPPSPDLLDLVLGVPALLGRLVTDMGYE